MDRRNIASLFNEFIENSSNCIETMSQNRELKQINNEMKKLMIKMQIIDFAPSMKNSNLEWYKEE